MTNYALDFFHGRSVAFSHTGAPVVEPAPDVEGLYIADFDISALRRWRAGHAALMEQPPRPELCELKRRDEYARQNVFERVLGTV